MRASTTWSSANTRAASSEGWSQRTSTWSGRSASDLVAHAFDRALGHDVAAVDQHHAIGELVDLVQDVARDHQRPALARAKRAEELDGLGARQRVEPVERLVEHQHAAGRGRSPAPA